MDKKKSLDFQVLKRVLRAAIPYKGLFIRTLVLAICLAPITSIRPYLVKVMVDDYIMIGDLSGLQLMAILFISVIIINAILRYIFILSSATLGQSIVKDLRTEVFHKIIHFKLQYFNDTAIGTSTTRTINDIQAINRVFEQGVITIVADILSILAILGIMFYTSWRLTLICLVTLPFLILATYVFKEKVKVAYQKVRTQISSMNAFLQERISGMRIVQLFNSEAQERAKFKEINHAYTQANLDSILYYAVFFPVVELISAVALALMVWLGSKSYLEGSVSFGALVAFPMYLNLLFRPVRMLADKFNQMQMGLVAADRVFDVLDHEAHITNEGTTALKTLSGDIRFDDVRFSYDGVNEVLKGISFNIKDKQTLAIIGSTGSGKSTIINLLNRFYDVNNGVITIHDTPISNFELKAYRSKIAVVLQDVFLFKGTVYDNITLRDNGIPRERVIQAAKDIGAYGFIMDMPGGFDYMLMERGGNLSAGQRQLISFVRALVIDPDILVLDEATSSIDTETEAVIQHAIETLIEKRTSVIIAHRLSTIKHADNILVLDKGKIVESGKHQELLKNPNGRYRELYEMQLIEE